MINAIIIDDEEAAQVALHKLLEWNAPEVHILEMCSNVDEGIKAIKRHKPDLIFLDIEMPVKNGFDLLSEITEIEFEVVFVTAYDQFAVEAFKRHALAYLLKPVDEDELIKVVDRAKKQIQTPLNAASFTALFETLKTNQPQFSKVAFPTMDGLELVNVEQISHCSSDGNYTRIFIKDRPALLISKTLKQVEEILKNYTQFTRVHHSHLINLYFVKRYNKGKGGSVELEAGEIIPVSRSRRDRFLNQL